METALAPNVSLRGQAGRFVLHYFEMCIPMCIGFAVGDLIYFSIAGLLGYSEPFTELPVASVLVVTFAMTAPMTAWMLYRGMPRRAIWEMSATMPKSTANRTDKKNRRRRRRVASSAVSTGPEPATTAMRPPAAWSRGGR